MENQDRTNANADETELGGWGTGAAGPYLICLLPQQQASSYAVWLSELTSARTATWRQEYSHLWSPVSVNTQLGLCAGDSFLEVQQICDTACIGGDAVLCSATTFSSQVLTKELQCNQLETTNTVSWTTTLTLTIPVQRYVLTLSNGWNQITLHK